MLTRFFSSIQRVSASARHVVMSPSGDDAQSLRATTPTAAPPEPAPSTKTQATAPVSPQKALSHPRWARDWLVISSLAAILMLQIAVAERETLGQRAAYRPALSVLCRLLHCDLAPWHEPTAFTMLQRDIRAQPSQPGILSIQVTFRNDARWPQAWPILALRLFDADGRLIGAQRFRPEHYLGRSVAADPPLLTGQSAHCRFYIREPASNTAAFAFDFL